jgi:hypothetical protein
MNQPSNMDVRLEAKALAEALLEESAYKRLLFLVTLERELVIGLSAMRARREGAPERVPGIRSEINLRGNL